jgi:hypothetical protein
MFGIERWLQPAITDVRYWKKIITYVISSYHHLRCKFQSNTGEVCSMQHYANKFVSDLRQVGGYLRVLRFPPQIKLTTTI